MNMQQYDDIFQWIKHATKAQRHIPEMEDFAKKHPIIFMKFHTKTKGIIGHDSGTEEYEKSKRELIELFEQNKQTFDPLLEVIRSNLYLDESN